MIGVKLSEPILEYLDPPVQNIWTPPEIIYPPYKTCIVCKSSHELMYRQITLGMAA